MSERVYTNTNTYNTDLRSISIELARLNYLEYSYQVSSDSMYWFCFSVNTLTTKSGDSEVYQLCCILVVNTYTFTTTYRLNIKLVSNDLESSV